MEVLLFTGYILLTWTGVLCQSPVGSVPTISSVPSRNSAIFNGGNPQQTVTAAPWTPTAGVAPTAPSRNAITFVSVSGAYPPVTVPDNGNDDHYLLLKTLFDTYFPNVPPLRRSSNGATFQIFQTRDGISATAVISDDPSTIYYQYSLPMQNAVAYIPFERTGNSNRRLKYPRRPIYLPYPQLAVRVPSTGETFPVYIPFQPNEFRQNFDQPEVFIPYVRPGRTVPIYEAALPADPPPLPTTMPTVNPNSQIQSGSQTDQSPNLPVSLGTVTTTPVTKSIQIVETGQRVKVDSPTTQLREFNDVNPATKTNPIDPVGQTPMWDDLRVTWGFNGTNPLAYSRLPKRESDAIIDGYTLITDCSGSRNFIGKRYWRNFDPAVILIFDSRGLIAGFQTGIPANLPNGYPTNNLRPRPFVQEGNYLYLTTYFTDPSQICSSSRTDEQLTTDGIGKTLYFQNGPDPFLDSVIVPYEESSIKNTLWGKAVCVPNLGNQYHYNMRKDMYCEEIAPIHLMYDKGKLVAFAWFFVSDIPSPRYEKLPQSLYPRLFQNVPDCLYSMGQVTSLHVFLTNKYREISCPAT